MTILVTSSLSFQHGFPVAFMLGSCSVLSCSRFRVRCSHDVTQYVALYPSDLASSLGATASAPRECGFIWLCGPLLGPLIQPSDAWPPSGNPGLGSRRHLANRVTFGCKT